MFFAQEALKPLLRHLGVVIGWIGVVIVVLETIEAAPLSFFMMDRLARKAQTTNERV